MTQNRRIFLNIIATYGRSLYALVIGLFCGRWTLMALGEVDYGLMGVVGGMTMFITFFNDLLATTISRFYAYSVGAAQRKGNEEAGLEECRRWFTVATSLHTIVPMILMLVGYPIGVWAVRNYLSIPPERVSDCVWVFRYVCISCFLGMVTVPFMAMYRAKQYIAELTIYSFVSITLNVIFLYYMVTHPRVWLATFAGFTCFLSVVPLVTIAVRACFIFKECGIRVQHLFNLHDLKELSSFAWWSFFGSFGNLVKGTGMSILVNKMLGPSFNATASISQTVSAHTQTLSGSIVGAFMPAITNACGAKDRQRMLSLVYRTCKFSAALILPFAVPLAIEVDEVMLLWLKNPPVQSGFLCIMLMALLFLENTTTGLWVVIAANGRIACYQFVAGMVFVATLPIAWAMMVSGLGVYSMGYALLITLLISVGIRLYFSRKLVGVSARHWVNRIFVPLLVSCATTVTIGLIPSLIMKASFVRVCVTTAVCELVIIPMLLFYVLDTLEREFAREKLKSVIARFYRR